MICCLHSGYIVQVMEKSLEVKDDVKDRKQKFDDDIISPEYLNASFHHPTTSETKEKYRKRFK